MQIISIFNNHWPSFIEGFLNTLLASLIALIFSLLIGIIMGMLQISPNKLLSRLASIYVEFFRNIPLLVIVMFFYVVVPMYWFNISGFWAGVIGLTIYTSSFIADNVRAGILSVERGQMEAGLSQGFTRSETMRLIILPQAIRKIVPPLGNQFINLVKNSSILAVVAGLDLMYYGDLVASETFITLSTYTLVGIFYLFITVPLTLIIQWVEQYLNNLY